MRTFVDILKFVVQIVPFVIELLNSSEKRKKDKDTPSPTPEV